MRHAERVDQARPRVYQQLPKQQQHYIRIHLIIQWKYVRMQFLVCLCVCTIFVSLYNSWTNVIAVITDNQNDYPGNGSQMVPAEPSGTVANIGGNAGADVFFVLFLYDFNILNSFFSP